MSNQDYDVFVCYYEDLSKDFASKIHSVLTDRGYKVFVAHIRRSLITGDFRRHVDSVIEKSTTFILINTLDTLKRSEVIREVKEAFPNGDLSKRDFWIFRENNVDIPRGDANFTSETKIDLASLSQDDFSSDSELARAVVRKCENRRTFSQTKIRTTIMPPSQIKVKLSIKSMFVIDANTIIEEIQKEINHKNYENAIKLYDKVLDIDPINIGALNGKGILFGMLEKYDEAIDCFSSAILLKNDFSPAWVNKAYALSLSDRNDQALESVERALKIEKNEHNQSMKAHILFQLQRFDEVLELYDKILLHNPKNSGVISSKAGALARQGKFEDARRVVDMAIKEDKKNANAWMNLGVILIQEKKYDDALKCFDKTIELEPTNLICFINKGILLYDLRRYDDALKVHDMEIQLNPKRSKPYLHKGNLLNRLEKYDEAIILFDKSLEINPKNADAYIGKAISYENLKKHEEAQSNAQKSLELDSNNISALIFTANLLSQRNEYHEVEKILEKVLHLSPQNIDALNLMSHVLFKQEKYAELVELCNRGLQLQPYDTNFLVTRSAGLIELHRYDEAIKDCDTALQSDDTLAWAYFNKACAYAMMLQKTLAIEFLEKSIKIDNSAKEKALNDHDFDKIRQEPEFKKLMERSL